jgi:hypothetical protein
MRCPDASFASDRVIDGQWRLLLDSRETRLVGGTSASPRTVSHDSTVDSASSKGRLAPADMSYLLAVAMHFVTPSRAGGARAERAKKDDS